MPLLLSVYHRLILSLVAVVKLAYQMGINYLH
jgi:hypothetical protein